MCPHLVDGLPGPDEERLDGEVPPLLQLSVGYKYVYK